VEKTLWNSARWLISLQAAALAIACVVATIVEPDLLHLTVLLPSAALPVFAIWIVWAKL
jgi:hypothetical protein